MKSIEYYLHGMPISYEKRLRKTRKPSLRYEAWAKRCVEVLGVKSAPLGYVDVIEMDFSYMNKLERNNADRASSMFDVLKRANVVSTLSHSTLPDTRQKGRYWQGLQGVKIKLRVNEDHPLNKGVNWNEYNVVKEWV